MECIPKSCFPITSHVTKWYVLYQGAFHVNCSPKVHQKVFLCTKNYTCATPTNFDNKRIPIHGHRRVSNLGGPHIFCPKDQRDLESSQKSCSNEMDFCPTEGGCYIYDSIQSSFNINYSKICTVFILNAKKELVACGRFSRLSAWNIPYMSY